MCICRGNPPFSPHGLPLSDQWIQIEISKAKRLQSHTRRSKNRKTLAFFVIKDYNQHIYTTAFAVASETPPKKVYKMINTKCKIPLYPLVAVLIILSIIFVYLAAVDGHAFSDCDECREESATELMIPLFTAFLIPNFFLLLYVFVLRSFSRCRYIAATLFGLFGLLIILLIISDVSNSFSLSAFALDDLFSLIYRLALLVLFASGAIGFQMFFSNKRFLIISSVIVLALHGVYIIYNAADCARYLLPISALTIFTYCNGIFLSTGTALFTLAILLFGLRTNSSARSAATETDNI